MLRYALLFAFVLLTLGPAEAQRHHGDRFARAGDFALAFEAEWLAVRPFMGGVGGRYWVGDRSVLTASLGFGAAAQDDGRSESDGFRAGLGVGLEQHLGGSRRVSPFVAVGTEVNYEQSENNAVRSDGLPVRSERRLVSIGGALYAGVEYRFAQQVTLAAAHSVGVTYRQGEEVRDDPDGREASDISQVLGGTGTTSLVLSIYF